MGTDKHLIHMETGASLLLPLFLLEEFSIMFVFKLGRSADFSIQVRGPMHLMGMSAMSAHCRSPYFNTQMLATVRKALHV